MNPIYNRQGKVIAWLKGKDIYHLNGKHAGVLNGDNVHGHEGSIWGF